MKYENIETFLTVLDEGSIIKASDKLYISQGTASTRIKQLEDELNITLFHRQKGQRQTILTKEGEDFLPIAQQWLALWQDALNLQNSDHYQELKIAATDIIHLHTYKDLYNHFLETYHDIVLSLKTHHSSEIYHQIDNQLCDIGFCTNLYNYPNIQSTPIYEEDLVLVCHQSHIYNKTKKISDLTSHTEIFIPISQSFVLWHNRIFDYSHKKLITVGTVSMQTQFLNNERWTILPLSFAKDYTDNHPDYVFHKLKYEPPKRTIYLLTYKYPKPGIKKATQIFLNELYNFIEHNHSLHIIQNIE